MYRTSSGRSNVSSSSRSKESSSSASRSSRSATSKSGSTRDRSPRRSRSPSPRGRRRRSPSSSRSSRRSPSPRRSSRRRSSDRRSRSSDRRSRSSDRRSRSSDRRSRSSDRRSRSSDRRSRSSDRRSRSSDRRSRSSDRRSRSSDRRSRSSDRRSRSRSRSSDRRSRSSDRRSRSPRRRSRSPRRRSRSSDRRSRSSDRRSRSPDRRPRSPDRRPRSPDRRPRSPDRRPRSPDKRPRSPDKRPRSPDRRSPNRHSESSVEQNLQITVGNDRYSIDTPERRRLSDRLGSPVDSLSDVDRDDLADGPIFSRGLSQPRSLERYSSREKSPSSPYNIRHDEDYRSRDVFLHQSDYSINYDHLQKMPRESDRVGQLHRKSLYSSEDRGRDAKRPRYDRDDRLLDVSIEPQGFLPGSRNYRKRSISRSPSPTYLDEGFRELESARRKREEEELSRRLSRELPGSGYMIPGLTNPIQSSEPRYLYRPDEAPAMPKKSILKKRFDDPSVQPEAFSSSSAAVKEPPLLSNHPPLPQRSYIAPFSSEVDNFLKRFNKNPVAESANKESQGNVCDWRKYSGLQQNTFSFEQNFGSFLKQKEYHESTSEPVDRQSDFLLPHERASQDGSGFSRILGMMADSTSIQEKRRRSFPDIEDEEKFLYGDDEDDSNISPSTQKITMGGGKEPVSQKLSSPSSPSPTVKSDAPEEPRPEYEKIHDLLKTIGLDIGVAEIGKLAARTQERLHGKKPSRSPDRHLVASHKPESQKMHRSRSDTRSPEPMQKRSLSPSGSCSSSKAISSVSKSEYIKSQTVGQDNPAGTPERSDPPVSLIPSAPPALPNLPPNPTSVSQYSVSRFSPFTATQLPPNYPNPTIASPGYDAYGHYMAYAASGWPMYAPPQQADPALSDVHGLVTLTVPPNPTRPNLRVIETVSTGKGTSEIKRDDSALVHIPTTATYSRLLPQFSQPSSKSTTERVSDEKNRASQKQKVIGEREKLKAEQEARQKKLHYLRTELDRLSKQQGEMLRKKRREKDGHKDPLLVEVNRLQENIVKEIAQLQIHAEAAEKKQSELDKVAQILGINIFEKSRKQSTENKDSSEKNKSENAKCQEKTSSSIKESKTCNDKGKSPKPTESSSQPSKQHFPSTNVYEYYDAGGHWCKNCNITCGTMFDFFTHMHNKKHRKTLDPYNRPWASKTQTEAKQEITKRVTKIIAIAKGSEFLIPVTGYYCQLCHEFFGDQISAEQHVKSHPHNEKYKKHIDDHGLYEARRNLDRQVGSSVIQVTQCRLKRKQYERQKEDRDEKTAKVSKKEEPKGSNELGGGDNKNEISNMNEDSTSQKFGIRLKLKKDLKEAEEKEGKREESQKESRQPSFGKFSWRKTEKDGRNQGKDECAEEGKDKESKSGKSNSKTIAIKLSGKTVIPHTSRWTPVVSTSSQPKIRPNVPAPSMVLRKNATTTVSKPAPLNTFLSIKSSGATTKPLPVVKEGNPELILPPDIISKAFGGEVVVLKGSQEDSKVPGPEEPDQETVTRAIEHARALKTIEQAKALEQARKRVQEQVMIMAKAQAKARELATMAKEQEMARKAQEQEMARKAQEQEIEKKARLNERILAQEQEMARKAQKLAALAQEQEISKMARMNERILEQSCRRPPLLPLPQGLRPAHLPLPTPVLYPPPPALLPPTSPALLPPTAPALLPPTTPALLPPTTPAILADDMAPGVSSSSPAILADDMAPGVSEDDKNILAVPMCPHPLPPPTIFRDQAKKLEKKNSSLAAGNAKDLYGIFYNSGRSPAENKPANALDKEKLNPSETETSIDMLAESKPSNNSSSPKYLQNVDSSSDVSKIPLGDGTPETELVEVEKILAAYEENFKIASSVEGASDNISLSDTHSTFKYGEASESHVLPANASVSFQNVVMGTPPLAELSSNPSGLESAVLMLQLPESSAPPLDEVSKKPSELQSADFKSSDDKVFSIQLSEDNVTALEDDVTALEDLTKKSSELQAAIAVQSSAPLDEVSKKPSVLETAELAMQLSECSTPPLNEVSKKPLDLKTAELAMQLPESSALLLGEICKKAPEFETNEFKSDDKEIAIQLSEDNVTSFEDLTKKPSELETVELAVQLPESRALLLGEICKKAPEFETDEFKSDDKEIVIQLSEDSVTSFEDLTKKPSELETVELAVQSPESSALLLGEICKKAPEFETDEFKSDDKEIAIQLSEDSVTSFEDLTKKPSELETVELAVQSPESSALLLGEICKKAPEFETDEFKSDDKEIAIQLSEDSVTSFEDLTKKPSELETVELAVQSPESSALLLGEICKKAPEFETDEFKSDDKEIAIQLSEDNVTSFEDLTKKPSELETVELAVQLPESSALLLGEICKKTSEFETDEFKSDDKEIAIQLSEDHVTSFEDLTKKSSDLETVVLAIQLPESSASPLDEVSKNPSELESIELAMQLPESSTSLLGEICKKTSEFETAEFKSSAIQLSEYNVTSFEDLSKKAPEFETAEFKASDKEIAIQLSEDNVTSFEDLAKKSSELEAVELAMQLPESGTGPLGEICMKSLALETAEFKCPDAKILEMQLPGRETDCSKESVAMRDVDMTSEYISQPQNQQEVEVHDGSELKEIKSDLETKAYVISLGERHVEREHSELAGHQFAISQGDPESQLFEMQIDIHKGKGPTLTEEKQSDDCSELPVSTWVSEMCVQSHLTWKPIDSSKANKENSQVMTDQSSKKSQLNLKLGGVDGLESAIGDKNPPISEVQNMEPELKPLNKGQFDSFHANNEDKELLGNSQPKDSEDFNVSGLGEMQEECFVNVTMISSVLERHEEICQQPSNCEVKNFPVQGTEDPGSISNTNDVEPCSSVELMFIKNDTQRLSGSDIGLSDIIERGPADKENTNFSTVQSEIVKEPVDSLPAEFSVGHLEEEEALAFTGMKTGVLNTSTAGDFDLSTTYSELNFDQSTTLTLNLNVANEKGSPKSDEVKPSGPSILKPGLELETIDFSLGDVEVDREHLDILPSEILNEDTVDSPKLETIAPISLESCKTCELAIDQPGGESEIIDSVALTAGDQEGKLCSLVSDVVVPASNGGTAETGMPYLKTQDMPQISEALLQTDSGKSGTPDVLLSCGGKDVQNQAVECLESPLPDLKATSIEAGSGDNELYIVKNTMHTSAELTESEEMES